MTVRSTIITWATISTADQLSEAGLMFHWCTATESAAAKKTRCASASLRSVAAVFRKSRSVAGAVQNELCFMSEKEMNLWL